MQGFWNTSGLWTAVDAYCISFVTANRLQTKNWVSVNVNVQGSGIRREIIKRNLGSTEKPPYDQSFIVNSSIPRPKHIR